MRMWMVDPKIMCSQHLVGEHLEIHMFIGTLRKGVSIAAYVRSNAVEPKALYSRHEELIEEMGNRGYKKDGSPVDEQEVQELIEKLPEDILNAKVDVEESQDLLLDRCEDCRLKRNIVNRAEK